MLKTWLSPVFAAAAASFFQQVWWLRGIEGAAFGAIAFVLIPAAINWAGSRPTFITLRVDCVEDFLPIRLPNEGRVAAIQLKTTPEVPHQAGQVLERYGDQGAQTGWPPKSHAYRCEVRNPSGAIIFDVALTLSVDFNEAVALENGSDRVSSQTVLRSGSISIVAPRLDAPFVFYVVNDSPYFAAVTSIDATFLHPEEGQPLLKVSRDAWRRMTFTPFRS
jgi:hypothetical protein